MGVVVVATLLITTVAGFVCVRARKYVYAIVLCGAVVPCSFVLAAIMFAAVEHQRSLGVAVPPPEFLLFGYGSVATALLAAVWALAAGLGAVWRRRTARWERLAEPSKKRTPTARRTTKERIC